MQIIVGDIGGTNARLALVELGSGPIELAAESRYDSRACSGPVEFISDFLAQFSPSDVQGAYLGVAGPVLDNRCKTTNLPWLLDARELSAKTGIPKVRLLNDLAAAAWGIDGIGESDCIVLNEGVAEQGGNQSVVAAGTAFGQAGRVWCADGYKPFAAEGSHADFAPGDEKGFALLRWLRDKYGPHVSWERVVSGPALVDLHAFLLTDSGHAEPDWLADAKAGGDPAAAVSAAALERGDPLAAAALRMMITYFGAEAGNHALKLMATGGVYLAGGIAPKIADRLQAGEFMEAFTAKGRMQDLLARMPVKIVTDNSLALRGAAYCAARTLGADPGS